MAPFVFVRAFAIRYAAAMLMMLPVTRHYADATPLRYVTPAGAYA